jgi:hypothetical protein
MGVQTFATTRNAQVEGFVDFILEQYCEDLSDLGLIDDYSVESQCHYESDIASDIWDHLVSFIDKETSKRVQLWCQTTCYKGNKLGKPESNKTYEVRETLVEAISIREKLLSSDDVIRTVHLTVGSKKYTYDWFAAAKENTFDLSLYLDIENEDVFEAIADLYKEVTAEFQLRKKYLNEVEKDSNIGSLISSTKDILLQWYKKESMPLCRMANLQYSIVKNELNSRSEEIDSCISRSSKSGLDIKGRANKLVHGADEKDELIVETVDLLLQKNPFIKIAQEVVKNWENYSSRVNEILLSSDSLKEFISNLWSIKDSLGLVIRRLLLRVSAEESVHYVQDLDIDGVTEHNLYKGKLSEEQLSLVVSHVEKLVGEVEASELCNRLISNKAKNIIRSAIWFEAKNGTSLKPSFDYIELALKKSGYRVEKASVLKDKAIGYHSEFAVSGEKVNPYTNLKVILDENGNLLAFLKGKFFRQQEFPRRCKEEAYVSLTLKYRLSEGEFINRYSVPFIMFVDMPSDITPPEYALRRLASFGWSVAFNESDILDLIE